MPLFDYQRTLATAQIDGPSCSTAARVTCLPTQALYTLPPGYFDVIGKQLLIEARGRISCAVTTPGTARFDVNALDSAAANAIVADSTAMNLNIVAKTNVPWWLRVWLTCRAVGSAANLDQAFAFGSEAVIGSPLSTVGGNGVLYMPSPPGVVGASFNALLQQQLDLRFTQTVGTGGMTLHGYSLIAMN